MQFPRVTETAITQNGNVELVATFDGQTPPSPRAYEAELREYENSRDFREFDRIMRQRNGVRM